MRIADYYGKFQYYLEDHNERYRRHVLNMKPPLLCRVCEGSGERSGYYPCVFCEGTGLVTAWMRGQQERANA